MTMYTQSLYSLDQNLVKAWSKRLSVYKKDPSLYAQGYRDALSECIEELNLQGYPESVLLSDIPDNDMQEWLQSIEADNEFMNNNS